MTALHRLIRDPRLFWGGLFALTLALNIIALVIVRKYREQYE